jgi:hypothetical protein
MAMQKATIGAIVLITIVGVVMSTLGALTASRTFSNTGSITTIGVGVYSDSGCTTLLSSINWGTINPGASVTSTIYVKNNGTIPVVLTMTTGTWSPTTASSYISLSWNVQGYVLAAGSSVQALLTLSVSSSVSGLTSFTFDITITGTQST